jgi:transcriptional regulator
MVAADRLDLLILKALALAPLHGYGIAQRIEQMSGGVFHITLGALYPALRRLERRGDVRGSWSVSDNNRRARYYTLTAAGRRRLASGRKSWERTVAAMARVLHANTE